MEMNYGLRHNSVRSIIQDSTGRTWLGTEAGLLPLESNNSYAKSLSKELEKEVIISLCNTNNFLLVGTAANGLKIYDLKKHKQIHHPVLRSIRYVRRIRLLRGDIYVAANSASWKITFNNDKIHLIKIHRPVTKGIITDFYTYDEKIYAFDLRVVEYSRILEIKGKKAIPTSFPLGYPPNPILSFLSAYGNDSLQITAGDGFYATLNKKNETTFKKLYDSAAKLLFPVWDLTTAKDKIFLALGQQNQLTMGLTYEVGVNSIKDIRNDFFCHSLYYNKKHDALWIGTYNRGLFIWPKVTLSERLPIKLNGPLKVTVGQGKIRYIYNEKEVYLWDTEKKSIKLIKETSSDPLQANIISVDYKNDSLGILSTNNFSYSNGEGKNLFNYPYQNYAFSHYKHLGDSLFFFTMHGDGIHAVNLKTKKISVLPDPSIEVTSKPYKNGFIYFADERGFYFHDTTTKPLTSSLTKIQSFEVVGDKIWVLMAGRIIHYQVNLKEGSLKLISELVLADLITGVTATWIKTSSNRIFTGNNNGFFEISPNTGKPLWYSYLGKYSSTMNPTVSNDTIFMIQDQYLEKHPLNQPYLSTDLKNFEVSIDEKNNLFEHLPTNIQVNHPDYFLQRYALKRLELTDEEGTIQTYYTLNSIFHFASGFKKGKYKGNVFVNNVAVNEFEFRITIPLFQNPVFYTLLTIIFIALTLQVFRYRINKQSLERNMLGNRLELLKKNLDPHFIFNSLNLTYMLLLQNKNKEAIDSITQFSDLHRYFLETINKNEIQLSEELKFIKNYLDLEYKRVHIDAPFTYTIEPLSDSIANILIPPMILHPLVENAVKYCGFDASISDHGEIIISIGLKEGNLVISIENSLGINTNASNIGYKKGVEIVKETIAIYNKMGNHKITFFPSLPAVRCKPGYRCQLVIQPKARDKGRGTGDKGTALSS
jgi:hypothetical protein